MKRFMRNLHYLVWAGTMVGSFSVAAFDDLSDVKVVKVGADQAGAFCADFKLSEHEVALVLRKSKEITTQEYLDEYPYLPCYVKGTALLEHVLVEWTIRAGGNAVIKKANDVGIYLGCPSCKESFGTVMKLDK